MYLQLRCSGTLYSAHILNVESSSGSDINIDQIREDDLQELNLIESNHTMESENDKDKENEIENEPPHEPEMQLTLLNFSFEKCGFEYSLLNGLDFDEEEFIRHDDGQIQDQPTIFDGVDLIGRLRDMKQRNSMSIPPILYDFYEKCK
jgi:hypothetical protein